MFMLPVFSGVQDAHLLFFFFLYLLIGHFLFLDVCVSVFPVIVLGLYPIDLAQILVPLITLKSPLFIFFFMIMWQCNVWTDENITGLTSCIAFITTCCTDTSIDIILWMYSCLAAQFTAQPNISCSNLPNSDVLQFSPVIIHKLNLKVVN